jgi:hypothetical protein
MPIRLLTYLVEAVGGSLFAQVLRNGEIVSIDEEFFATVVPTNGLLTF